MGPVLIKHLNPFDNLEAVIILVLIHSFDSSIKIYYALVHSIYYIVAI